MNHSEFEIRCPSSFNHESHQEIETVCHTSSKSLRRDLREHLLALPYRAFLLLIAQLLERQGGQQVHLLGREGFVGRNRGGGWDLEATLPPSQGFAGGQPAVRCIIQVKQFDDLAVQQRTVDELRGCCLRAGAGQGLLVTTSRFSPVAVQAAAAAALAPIALINGEDLLGLLIQHGMGVFRSLSGQLHLDPEFFQSLRPKADAPVATLQRRTNKLTERSVVPTASLTSLETKPHRRQTTVLHFSVTLDARPGGVKKGQSRNEAGKRNDWGMTGPSHIALGVASIWLLRLVPGVVGPLTAVDGSSPGLLVGAAALGALLPDLDAAHSTVKYLRLGRTFQPFRVPARILSGHFTHRGPLHSLVGLGLLWLWTGVPTLLWFGWQPSMALALGLLSHLMGDASTKSGVPLLYPRPGRWHLLPAGWRLTTGSPAEHAVFIVLLVPVLLLLFGFITPT